MKFYKPFSIHVATTLKIKPTLGHRFALETSYWTSIGWTYWVSCCSHVTVYDARPTLSQHWANVSCLLGSCSTCWPKLTPRLGECLMFVGVLYDAQYTDRQIEGIIYLLVYPGTICFLPELTYIRAPDRQPPSGSCQSSVYFIVKIKWDHIRIEWILLYVVFIHGNIAAKWWPKSGLHHTLIKADSFYLISY